MLSIIVAHDRNRVIGNNNQLPWHLPQDLAYFKKVTMGKPVIMGRKTHESIGRVLPGRENIVMTRNKDYQSNGCTIIHSLNEIKQLKETSQDEIFIIGGAEIFEKTLSETDRLYITYIDEEFEGDTFFPKIDYTNWREIAREKGIKDEKNPYDYEFIVYERKK